VVWLAVVVIVRLVVIAVSVVKLVDVDGTIVVPDLCVQVRVDTAVQAVVERVTVRG
jgi:hypothetical protein